MKNKILLVITILIAVTGIIWGQCRQFTEEKVVPKVGDYILTGRYHAFVMSEGDQILIFKTLNRNIKYKFIVEKEQSLPANIHFVVKDWQDHIIYDNSKTNFSDTWEFLSEKPQRIKIYISIPKVNNDESNGCVSLVIGMKKVSS